MDEEAIKAAAGELKTEVIQEEKKETTQEETSDVAKEDTDVAEEITTDVEKEKEETQEETQEEVQETKEEIEEEVIDKETVVEDVKENLTTESKETVEEVVEKEANGEELNKHEKLVSDLLDEIQVAKTNSRTIELENDVLKKTVEKLQEQVVGQKSNPNIIEVPDDLLPLVKQYSEYSKDRSKDDVLMKVVNATYGVVDMLGGPSLGDSVNEFISYKQKINGQWSGNKSENTSPTKKPIASTGKGGISLGVTGANKYSFTNRTL